MTQATNGVPDLSSGSGANQQVLNATEHHVLQAVRRKVNRLAQCLTTNANKRRPQMFPAVFSSKLEAAIAHEERRKRNKMIQAEQSKGEVEGAEKGDRASEFEMLLNEYSKIDADEITVRSACDASDFHRELSGGPWTCSLNL